MSARQLNELEKEQEELELRRIAGKTNKIEINERTLEAYRTEFRKKGLEPESKDYPMDDFVQIAKLKQFDALVDPSQGIRKVIESMVRQPVTVFNKQGKPEVKDALYYNGYYYGNDKHGNDLGAEFYEGYFKKPKLVFSYTDAANPFDPKTGERRGEYEATGRTLEHYIFLPEKKEDRIEFLHNIVDNATGTSIANLSLGGHLSYRNPTQNNDHGGTHGGSFTWQIFSELSLEELGELQNKNYYVERNTGQIKDRTGARVAYDHSTKKVEPTKDR